MVGWSPQPGQVILSEMKKFVYKGTVNYYVHAEDLLLLIRRRAQRSAPEWTAESTRKVSLPWQAKDTTQSGGKQAARQESQSPCGFCYGAEQKWGGKHWFDNRATLQASERMPMHWRGWKEVMKPTVMSSQSFLTPVLAFQQVTCWLQD